MSATTSPSPSSSSPINGRYTSCQLHLTKTHRRLINHNTIISAVNVSQKHIVMPSTTIIIHSCCYTSGLPHENQLIPQYNQLIKQCNHIIQQYTSRTSTKSHLVLRPASQLFGEGHGPYLSGARLLVLLGCVRR